METWSLQKKALSKRIPEACEGSPHPENSEEALAGVAPCSEPHPTLHKDSEWWAPSLAGGVQEAADRRVSFTWMFLSPPVPSSLSLKSTF